MKLEVKNIKLSEQFNDALLQLGVVMPIDHHPREVGEIVDAMGRSILQVDPNRMLPDKQAQGIAAIIILAVNSCGSFIEVRLDSGENDEMPSQ